MSKTIRIRKGVNIRLVGEANKTVETPKIADIYAVRPPNFHNVVPKMLVKAGGQVKAGDPIFYAKGNEEIKFCSPVSGEVAEIVRGEKRRILEVRILADREVHYNELGVLASGASSEAVKEKLLSTGLWPFLRQRPYDVLADPGDQPKAIYVSGFDSAPLAPDAAFVMKSKMDDFQKGIDALAALGGKPVQLGVESGNSIYNEVKNVTLHQVSGPHPAGNVGVQIHHTNPINKGEVIWYVNYQDVANIGNVLSTGKFNVTRTVAFAGSCCNSPKYYNYILGASVKTEVIAQQNAENCRVISGNVLTGEAIAKDGFLGYFDNVVTLIPEGTEPQFLLTRGWLSPGFHKHSVSHSYPSWIMKGKEYDLTTNLNGEERAFVVTGQYEKVFPFDIYPVQLIKSIMANDIDKMEKLGIYEIAPEDFALCEYVCTSKLNVQSIVREGLDLMKSES